MKASLAHVLWIGGSTDAGKTSVAQTLAAKHGWQEFHYDRFDRSEPPGHWARIDSVKHPHMRADWARSRDDCWVNTTPEEMVARWLLTAPERFQLTLEDLQPLSSATPIVAEGYGFLPELVLPLLSSPRQAIWLVSTEEFKRASYARRRKGAFTDTSNPRQARRNHIGRDMLLATYVKQRAKDLGLTVVEVDGTRSLEDVVALVDEHFAGYIIGTEVNRCE